MTSTENSVTEHTVKGVRRAAIWTIIVSLVAAAGIGIATIVTGNFGELQSKVLLTTLAVAAFAILALCHLAIITKDVRVLGWIGIGTSGLALASSIVLIWWDWNSFGYSGPSSIYMAITKTFTISTLAAVSFAHANLMLLMARTPLRWMRIALDVNLVLIGIVPLLVVPVILTDGTFPPASLSDVYWRFFGVVIILDALGTVALPITSLILRGQRRAAGLESAPESVTITLRDEDASWIVARAGESRSTPLAVVEALIQDQRKK